MEEQISDSESVFSVDSLEAFGDTRSNQKYQKSEESFKREIRSCSKIPVHRDRSKSLVTKKETLSEINEDGFIPAPKCVSTPRNNKVSKIIAFKNDDDHKHKLNETEKHDPLNRIQQQHSVINSQQDRLSDRRKRVSRQKSTCFDNCDILRTRHRSVSYLDQFRKKLYGCHKVDSSILCLQTDSDFLSDQNLSASYLSCLSGKGSVKTSELDFYDDLVNSSTEKLVNPITEVKNRSGHKLTLVKPILKQNVKKINADLEVVKKERSFDQRNDVTTRNFLQRREEYANKVKLKNQFQIRRQREKEKIDKFKDNPLSKSHAHEEECPLLVKENTLRNISSNYDSVSTRIVPTQSICSAATVNSNTKTNNKVTRNLNVKRKLDKKLKSIPSDISALRQRHETEKQLVKSMRSNLIKT